MKSFYTFVDRVGHRVFARYIDEDGRRRSRIITEYPFELFIRGHQGDSRALMGEPLSRVSLPSVAELLEFNKVHSAMTPVYGQTSPAHQFIAKEFPGQLDPDMSKLVILNFDIEVEHDDGFPEPFPAAQEILSITYKVFGREGLVTLGTKSFSASAPDEYVQCRDEKHLLLEFLTRWRSIDPDIVTGWNISGFDIPYIINRMTTVLGEKPTTHLSPFWRETERVFQQHFMDRDAQTYRILGVNIFDYQTLYMKFAPRKLESYRLDYVAEVEVGANKVDLTPWGGSLMRLYREDYDTFCRYNCVDVELVEKIDNKLKFIRTVTTIALLTKSRYHEALASARPWDNLIYNMLLEDGIQIPPEPEFNTDNEGGIAGAFVKEPIPGAYRWVVSLDLTSLYPSIVQMYNMSPETIVRDAADDPKAFLESLLSGMGDVEDRKAQGWVTAANGSSYSQEQIGILPRAMKMLFDDRRRVKGRMLDEQQTLEKMSPSDPNYQAQQDLIAQLDALQLALKILANSGYGVLANRALRYYNVNIAEGVTLTGQLTIRFISDRINAALNKRFGITQDRIVANDTDSSYVHLDDFVRLALKIDPDNVPADKKNRVVDALDAFVKKEIEPLLEREFEVLAEMVGSRNNTMKMKREAIADVAVFRGKKNYIMQVFDQEGVRYTTPVIKTVGVEAQRTSTPKIIRDELKACFRLMLNEGADAIHEEVKQFKDRFYSADVSTIAYPRGVSDITKWVEGGVVKKGCPINSRAAILYNQMVLEKGLQGVHPLIKEGSKIKFVYLKVPNPSHSNVVGFITDLPAEFNLEKYVDKDKMWESLFVGPLESFTHLMGYGHRPEVSLDDMWE